MKNAFRTKSFRLSKRIRLRSLSLVLLVFAASFNLFSQTRQISGEVVSEADGFPMVGVSVVIKGTTTGTITDMEGTFEIQVPDSGATLEFSFIGYEKREEPTSGRRVINITLSEIAVSLGEVVVTALNMEKDKSSLGYSVSQLNGEEVSQAKENNVMNSLSGKVAGLQITKSPSGVDGSTRVVLRGVASLSGGNRPLIVIDGIPISGSSYGVGYSGSSQEGVDMGDALSDINPEDVESISVLKGAGASAAYGSRGGNGVILITTKKGKAQKKGLGVSLNSSFSMQQPYVYQDIQNQYGQGAFGSYPEDILASKGSVPFSWSWGPEMDGRIVTNHLGEEAPFVPVDDPFKTYYQNGFSLMNTLAFNGGNESSGIRVSLTQQTSEGIVPNNTLAKQTLNARGSTKLGKVIEVDSKITYIHHKAQDRPYIAEDNASPSFAFLTMPRNISTDILKNNTTDADGNQIWYWDQTSGNPYWAMENKRNGDERNRLQALLSLKFNITEKLNLITRSGIDLTGRITNGYGARGSNNISNYQGNYSHNWSNSLEWNSDFLLRYSADFSTALKIDFNLGGNYRYSQGKSIWQSGTGWKVPDFYKMQNLETYRTGEGFSEKEVWSIYFLTNLSLKNFLYFDFTLRNDVSSTIPVEGGANSYLYHSENISFLFTNLMNTSKKVLSSGKLRASYALVGNDTGPYQTNNYYYLGTSSLPYPQAYIRGSLAFYDLNPEMTYSWEVGTNLGFFGNRLNLDLTYYDARTENQLMSVQMAPSTGYTGRKYNAGEVRNNGIEMQLTASVVERDNSFKWDIGLNMSRNSSKVVELYEGKERLSLSSVPMSLIYIEARPGEPYGQIYGHDYVRDEKGNILVDNSGLPLATEEMVALGNLNPDLLAGLSNSFTYKSLRLSFLIDAQIGGDYYSQSAVYGELFGTSATSLEGRAEWYATHEGGNNSEEIPGVFPDGYTQEGVNMETGAVNDIPIDPMARAVEVIFFRQIMRDYVVEATNIRMRELVLAYDLPAKWMDRTFIRKASISLVGR
ncbi:MAG: SusC/RagA family TonB-linked outer membrane protein, partial [Bacteroides sp.]|nr:SusC/RagA family TonB-linked outer membrane protein [Bacteroides sp.]